MYALVEIGGVFFALVAAIVSAVVGARDVRQLRHRTGDESALTALLSGELFSRRH